jgi:DNA replication protein DnaC
MNKILEKYGVGARFSSLTLSDIPKGLQETLYDIADKMPQSTISGSGLYLSGKSGCGKSVFMAILARTLVENGKAIKYTTSQDLVRLSINDYDLYEDTIKSKFLFIDNFGEEIQDKTAYNVSIINNLCKSRYDSNLCTYIATQLAPKEIEGLYGRTVVRIFKETLTAIEIEWK